MKKHLAPPGMGNLCGKSFSSIFIVAAGRRRAPDTPLVGALAHNAADSI